MFHWICPECGREIAPQAKECAACEPSSVAAEVAVAVAVPVVAAAPVAPAPPAPEPVLLELEPETLLLSAPAAPAATSEPEPAKPIPAETASAKPALAEQAPAKQVVAEQAISEPAPAPLQPRVSGAPLPPATALPRPVAPVGRDLSPVAAEPASARSPKWTHALPELEPARAPKLGNSPLRDSQPAAPATSRVPRIEVDPEFTAGVATLPNLIQPEPPAPPLASAVSYSRVAASQIKAAVGNSKPRTAAVTEQLSLPGPTLPHELTSLNAAGIAKIMVSADQAAARQKGSSWALSLMVAAFVIAGTLGAAFYAMPSLANTSAPKQEIVAKKSKAPEEPAKPAPPVDPIARVVEVTGVRFVTDLPDHAPEIHYLVVNHSNVPLIGVTVNVTLRASGAESPLSQFGFRAPRLGPYESKEMVSSIERFNRPVALPDWRDLHAEIRISQ